MLAQVFNAQQQTAVDRGDQHLRMVIELGETAAQGFVTRNDTRQGLLQRMLIQLPTQAQADGNVVRGVGAFHLCEKPQALLGERQRQRAVTSHRDNLRLRAAPGLRHRLGNRCQFGVGKQIAQRQLDTKTLANLGHHAHGQQRVTTELKKMILTPDSLDLQHLRPDLRQGAFQFVVRRLVFAGEQRRSLGFRQGLAVDLAIGGQRQRVESDEGHRHHVLR
ncbi:hypothetical protein D3C87_813290 [compost metagenome]